jgi:hypothetical protein
MSFNRSRESRTGRRPNDSRSASNAGTSGSATPPWQGPTSFAPNGGQTGRSATSGSSAPNAPQGQGGNPPFDFQKAQNWEIRFGKYKGRRVGDVGADDEGLLYLDWLLAQAWFGGGTREAVEVYLNDPNVAPRVNAAIDAKSRE